MASGLYDASYEHDACGVGMVADLHGRPDHDIVDKGLTVLERLAHLGASGAEVSTGDGAGILVQVPHRFLVGAAEAAGFSLPDAGTYAVGLAFLPGHDDDAAKAKKAVEALAIEEGLTVLGWRVVPVNTEGLGETALGALEERLDIIGKMLAVTIERQHPCEAFLMSVRPANSQRSAFAEVTLVSQHCGACLFCLGGRPVR